MTNRTASFAPLALAAALALGSTGCEPIQKLFGGDGSGASDGSSGSQVVAVSTFAVIDLNEIAQRIGRSAELQAALEGREQLYLQQLVQLQNNLQQKVDARRQQLGEQPTVEQQQELANLATELNREFARARATAQQALGQEQVSLIQRFRAEVLPIAGEIAAQRGLTTILNKNEAVLFAWDPNSDITEEVISRMSTPLVP